MKTASLPAIRVEPQVREQIESVLREGETLSSFMEASLRDAVQRRRMQSEFLARGMLAREEFHRTGLAVPAEEVLARIDAKIEAARLAHGRRRKAA